MSDIPLIPSLHHNLHFPTVIFTSHLSLLHHNPPTHTHLLPLIQPARHTCGIPIPCCQGDRLVSFSAILKYSESGRHGCTLPMLLCTLHWWQRPGWLGIQCLIAYSNHDISNTPVVCVLTQIHYVISAYRTVIHHDVFVKKKLYSQ